MRISVDDWRFRDAEGDTLVVDAYLDNGQHVVIEVNAMKNPQVTNGEIPEVIIFCEMPGEKLADGGTCPARWISRPPDKTCLWSSVQMPIALAQQIRDRLGVLQAH
jgi:hypothetical protein